MTAALFVGILCFGSLFASPVDAAGSGPPGFDPFSRLHSPIPDKPLIPPPATVGESKIQGVSLVELQSPGHSGDYWSRIYTWNPRIHNYPSEDIGYSVQQTRDGGYILAGYTGSVDNWSQTYVIKTGPNGRRQWQKTFGGNQNGNYSVGYSIQQTSDKGYIIAGGTSPVDLSWYVFLLKIAPNGSEMWNNTFGGYGISIGESVQQTSDGGYIITGMTNVPDPHVSRVYLIKTYSNGTESWNRTFHRYSIGYCVRQTPDMGFIIAGTESSQPEDQVYLIKTDSAGNEQWNRTFGGYGEDFGYSVHETMDGGYIVAGETTFDNLTQILLLKTDGNGIKQWNRTYNGPTYGSGLWVDETRNGGFIVTGTMDSHSNGYQVFLLKTGPKGGVKWRRAIGGAGTEVGYCVQQTKDDGFVIVGQSDSNGYNTRVFLVKTDNRGR